ncbi:MAG: glutamate-5-semialdehyde dehydrogenase [Victivallales bacterium]|nr:glutamate-5-semialdehyde dehydrogenase [Victivallales bacterium]
MLKMDSYINLIIPRGGENLIHKVVETSTIPIIKHYKGVCNIYIDDSADIDMAVNIVENAKCQRSGVCNAVENVLIHEDIVEVITPKLAKRLLKNDVSIVGDSKIYQLVPEAQKATEGDWSEEYLSLKLSIKCVSDLDEAVQMINRYGSGHSDSIITDNKANADYFMRGVDSSTVYHNASTRFTDGFEFGMGAEIGISTDKLHARGPMGLRELNTYKYLVYGNGQVRG